MKVLNLRCANGHGFEGWFDDDADFMDQNGSGRIACPLCDDRVVARMPSAPRLNLARPAEAPVPDLQAMWLAAARKLVAGTEDVGARFAEEARRIHYGEIESRGIRGKASDDERDSLRDEGIDFFSLPVPKGLDGPLQ